MTFAGTCVIIQPWVAVPMRLLLKRNASNSKLKGSIIMATQTKAEASRYYQLYNSARYYLFLIFALAVVNCFYCLSDGYFVLAPYESTVLLGIGLGMSAEAGSMVFYVIAAVLCVVVAVPYLLGGIFSKKHWGWMLACTILYGLDFGVLLLDAFAGGLDQIVYFLLDLLFHGVCLALMIVTIVKCRVAPENPAKLAAEAAQASDPTVETVSVNEDGTYTADAFGTRQLTLTRKKSFVGCAVAFNITVNGGTVAELKKGGEVQTVSVPAGAFRLGGLLKNGVCSYIDIPAGVEDLSYEVSLHMGALTNDFVFRKL